MLKITVTLEVLTIIAQIRFLHPELDEVSCPTSCSPRSIAIVMTEAIRVRALIIVPR
jgi:hypothetical protein